MTKEIIVLAKSIKHYPNYCIAGIDVQSGKWIRPISEIGKEGSVPISDITYEDGTEVNIFDIVRIEMKKHIPSIAQKENYCYDDQFYWVKIGQLSKHEIFKYIESPNHIFSNTDKYLTDCELDGTSLVFVRIENPTIVVKTFEKKKITISFDYNGLSYSYIKIGDPVLCDRYITYDDGSYSLGNEAYAIFSLTGKYDLTGKYYKMLAFLFYT